MGQTFRQFTFPVYGSDGQLRYTFFAMEATGITLNRAEASDLRIDVFENGQKTTTITSPKADLYVAEQKMRTKNTVRIERSDMEATSQDCDFDVKQKNFFPAYQRQGAAQAFRRRRGRSGRAKSATHRESTAGQRRATTHSAAR